MASSTIALIIIAVTLILYATELFPIAVTSICSCLALAIFGVVPVTAAFSGFSNDITFLLVGMMIIGNTLFETGVARVIGARIVSVVGTNERVFIIAITLVCVLTSLFMTNTAAAGIMLPIAASSVAASDGKLSKKNTYMLVGIAAVVGGNLTLVGSTPQLIAQGLLQDGGYETMSFFEIGYLGLPVLLLMLVYFQTIGYALQKKVFTFPEELSSAGSASAMSASDGKNRVVGGGDGGVAGVSAGKSGVIDASAGDGVGRGNDGNGTDKVGIAGHNGDKSGVDCGDDAGASAGDGAGSDGAAGGVPDASAAVGASERRSVVKMSVSAAILVFCVIGFIADIWSKGVVAMFGAVLCVATKCVSQKRVFETMDWTTVTLIGCSFGLSAGLERSGAGKLIAYSLIDLLGDNITPLLLCAAIALVAMVLTNFMSSTATAALLIPIAAFAAIELGYNVKSVVIATAISTSLGYATPISTPPITMTLSGGYRFMDYIKVGGLLNLLSYILIVALFPLVLGL